MRVIVISKATFDQPSSYSTTTKQYCSVKRTKLKFANIPLQKQIRLSK